MPGARVESGERVTLRILERKDIPFVQHAYANPELRYLLGTPLKNVEQLAEWIDDETSFSSVSTGTTPLLDSPTKPTVGRSARFSSRMRAGDDPN